MMLSGGDSAPLSRMWFLIALVVAGLSLSCAIPEKWRAKGAWHAWPVFMFCAGVGFVTLIEYYTTFRPYDPLRDFRFASITLIPSVLATVSLYVVKKKSA